MTALGSTTGLARPRARVGISIVLLFGWVKMREVMRFSGKPLSVTVRCVADPWFVSVPVEADMPEPVRENQAAAGIDLGITSAATLSSGEKRTGPRAPKANPERIRRLSRRHSRKVNGSRSGAVAPALPVQADLRLRRTHDRDVNNAAKDPRGAALARASSTRSHVCGEDGSGFSDKAEVKPSSEKQRSALSHLGMS